MKLILASGSPRRKELLKQAGFNFCSASIKISEIVNENLSLREALMDLARQKACAYLDQHNPLELKDNLLLTADTMVILEGRPLGKPKNDQQAKEYLSQLSGKTHSVMTGVCIFHSKTGEWVSDADETLVEFRKVTSLEISDYVSSGEPMDKAGAYAIQGEGYKFVKKIEGSWSNVVGLPMELLTKILNEKSWDVGQRKPSKN